MSFLFPPSPTYPVAIDSDYTLFKVYNTSESKTTVDTDAWADEIPVRPRKLDESEVWPNNGYATISGELFYFGSVQKNSNGKVCRLKKCTRQIGGRNTQFNAAGTWVRGFVIAEHHNQIANATLLAESFIGENFSEDVTTLDWRIRHLADSPFLVDDLCPDVDFVYEVVSASPVTGTTIRYSLDIRGSATFNLQFGDGTFTTSQKSGTHVYSPGSTITPVLVLEGQSCQLVVSPVLPPEPTLNVPLPPSTTPPPFTINIPVPPEIPPTTIPSMIVPASSLNLPPILLPGITSIPGGGGNTPSQIKITPVHIPSQIKFSPPIRIPSRIFGPSIVIPSVVNFKNTPSMMMFGPPPPIPPIQFGPCNLPVLQVEPIRADIPSVIRLESISLRGIERAISSIHFPSMISLSTALRFEAVPKLEFDAESIRTVFTQFRQEFAKSVKIKVPKIPDVKVDWSGMPTLNAVLRLESPKMRRRRANLLADDNEENVSHEEVPFNGEFKLLPPDIPDIQIKHNVPEEIHVRVPNIPDLNFNLEPLRNLSIPISVPDLARLKVEFPEKMPAIGVEFPNKMPKIQVEVPESAKIPMFYNGPPIPLEPVKINLVVSAAGTEVDESYPCVVITPCARR
jgi:hypothetical protein